MTDTPTTPPSVADFSHLDAMEVDATQTREYTLHALVGTPVLTLKPATEANVPFTNAKLRRATRLNRISQNGRLVTASILDMTRDEDRHLFAQHVITGWRGVKDKSGNDVPFTKQNCEEYLKHLPKHIFDDVRAYAGDHYNFTGSDVYGAEDIAKNA